MLQARKSALILGNNVVGAFLGLVAVFFMARYVEKDAVGFFAFAYSLLQLTSRLADMGLDRAHVKRVSEGQDLGDCIATFGAIKLVMNTTGTTVVLLGAYIWELRIGFTDSTTFHTIAIVSAYWFLFQLATVAVQTFNALRRTALSQLMALTENLVKTPAIVIVAITARVLRSEWAPFSLPVGGLLDRLGIEGRWSVEQQAVALGLAYTLGIFASFMVGMVILWRHRYPRGHVDRALLRSYVDFALPLAAVSIAAVFLRRVDTLMIGYFWSESEVADYFQADRLTTVLLMIPAAVGTLFFPLLSQLAHRGDIEGAQAVARSTQRTISLAVVPMAMLGIVYAREGIHIFLADRYLSATPVLRFLILYVVAQAFTITATNTLQGFGLTKTTMRAGFTMMGLNLVLNTVFIPTSILGVPLLGLKATGAALATAVSQSAGLLLLGSAVRRAMGRGHMGRQVPLHMGAAIVAGLTLHFTKGLSIFGGLDRVWDLFIAGTVGLMLYLVLLVAVREVTRKDWELALQVLHPGEMARYIRDELRGKDEQTGKKP